jgi:hypothetical protein
LLPQRLAEAFFGTEGPPWQMRPYRAIFSSLLGSRANLFDFAHDLVPERLPLFGIMHYRP